MFEPRSLTLGEEIFNEINDNEYLNEIYEKLLTAYTKKIFHLHYDSLSEKEIGDALRFADLLSKSNHPTKAKKQKVMAQQIISLVGELVQKDPIFDIFAYSVLSSCTNYFSIEQKEFSKDSFSYLDSASDEVMKKYLEVPYHKNEHFFIDQKEIFDSFEKGSLSYSAPTSMGKSFMMRIFIRHRITLGDKSSFAILVPTKALINEIRSSLSDELQGLLTDMNYRIVTSAGDIVLEQEHNFIYIMTPERLLYLLNSKANVSLDYLFIDEAHKICSKDARSTFYYQLIDKVSKKYRNIKIFFSSPNVPNPELYSSLIPEAKINKLKTTYSPVNQFKFLIDSNSSQVKVLNDITKKFHVIDIEETLSFRDFVEKVINEKQTLVYCNSINSAINEAVEFAKSLPIIEDQELEAIANDIRIQINDDYYLVELIKKGVAFHVGYLPTSIRLRIEKAFRNGKMRIIFSTSTLIEGVNLPAENLIITSYKNGRKNLDEVSFWNLIGRAGRLKFNLFGNVFIYRYKHDEKIDNFEKLLTSEVPNQRLSIETTLTKKQREEMMTSLANGDIEIKNRPSKTTKEQYDFMRKMSMLIIDDVVQENHDSYVVKSFQTNGSEETVKKINDSFRNKPKPEGIEMTYDQYENLRFAIDNWKLEYPKRVIDKDGNLRINFSDTEPFLRKLSQIFRWEIYETDTLGNDKLLGFYAAILNQWMSGFGLGSIVKYSLEYKRTHEGSTVEIEKHKFVDFDYNNKVHRNCIYAEVLKFLEHIVLFSISNYFRAFSTEYKRYHNIEDHFDNDWFEFVEYGTMSSQMINLQRVGYSRESAVLILGQKKRFIDESITTQTAPFVLRKAELLNCRDEGVKLETKDISINLPELFI